MDRWIGTSHPSAIPSLNPNRTFGEATSAMSFHDIEGNLFLRRHLSMFFGGWAKVRKIWKNLTVSPIFWGRKRRRCCEWCVFLETYFWGGSRESQTQIKQYVFSLPQIGMEWNSGIYTPLNWSTTKTDWIKHFPTKVNHQTQLLFSGWTL